jgi:16S rRNA (cytosine1402-N4)-methyltransferase
MTHIKHKPVLLEQAIKGLAIKPDQWYVDATIGGGGHTQLMLDGGAKVIGIDRDPVAIGHITSTIKSNRLHLIQGNFDQLTTLVRQVTPDPISGILLDLGTSAFQLNDPERGFSFTYNAPLDMRMQPDLHVTAQDLVNGLGRKELYDLFTNYAQENRARSIASAIVSARRLTPIKTTGQLADIVESVYGGKTRKIHPATKVFQALRIAVNDELNTLKNALPQAVDLLKPKGRLAIISFHQGEDKIAKDFFKHHHQLNNLTKKPITPTPAQKVNNPRCRSAKMRLAEKNETN